MGASSTADGEVLAEGGVDPLVVLLLLFLRVSGALLVLRIPPLLPFASS